MQRSHPALPESYLNEEFLLADSRKGDVQHANRDPPIREQ